jgi:cytochrome c oxidase subunit 2
LLVYSGNKMVYRYNILTVCYHAWESGMYQGLAWAITLCCTAAILLVFGYVALQARHSDDYGRIQASTPRIRAVVFWGLVVLFTPIIVYSLKDLPYSAPAEHTGPPEIIQVTGHQWRWDLNPNRAVVEQPVEFHVTSADVNHGFALYDPGLRLLAQTQAMPGYTNVLHYTFTRPGTYRILCLEYCGIAHHTMMAEFIVTTAAE